MSAISSLSFLSARSTGTLLQSAQQGQRVATSGSTSSARAGNTSSTSSAYCPTCGGGGSSTAARSSSSSYCPTCNRAGGTQSNISSFNSTASRTSAAPARTTGSFSSAQQGGQICVSCAYQGR